MYHQKYGFIDKGEKYYKHIKPANKTIVQHYFTQ